MLATPGLLAMDQRVHNVQLANTKRSLSALPVRATAQAAQGHRVADHAYAMRDIPGI